MVPLYGLIQKKAVTTGKSFLRLSDSSTPHSHCAARTKKQGYLLKIRDISQTFYDEIEPDRRETEEDKKYKKM